MSDRRITASRLPLLDLCAYTAREDVRLPYDRPSAAGAKGTARHGLYQWLQEARVGLGAPYDALACGLDNIGDHAAAVGRWLVANVPDDAETEKAMALDPHTGVARRLPVTGTHRDYSAATPYEICGTTDLMWFAPADGIAHVLDWKTGNRAYVDSASSNAQMSFLALCATRIYRVSEARVVLAFVDESGEVETDEAHLSQLDLDVVALRLAELAANKDKARPVPGDHCMGKFCPLRKTCPALQSAGADAYDVLPSRAA